MLREALPHPVDVPSGEHRVGVPNAKAVETGPKDGDPLANAMLAGACLDDDGRLAVAAPYHRAREVRGHAAEPPSLHLGMGDRPSIGSPGERQLVEQPRIGPAAVQRGGKAERLKLPTASCQRVIPASSRHTGSVAASSPTNPMQHGLMA